LTCFDSIVVSAGFGIGIVIDPLAVVAPKFSEIVIPVRTEGQGIAYEGPHDGATGPILDDLVWHIIVLEKMKGTSITQST
jgi:hypothetical protein